MRETMKDTFFRNLFLMLFLLINIFLATFCAVSLRQRQKARKELIYQEQHNQAVAATKVVDEKFSSVDLSAAQISSAAWFPYITSRSEILSSQIDYFERQEICQIIGNQNDSLRIAKSVAVLLPYKNLAVDKVSFWECERYFSSVGLKKQNFLSELTAQLEEKYGSLVLYTNEEMQNSGNSFCVLRQLEAGMSEDKLLFVYVDGKRLSGFLKNAGENILGFRINYEGNEIYSWKAKEPDFKDTYEETIDNGLHNWTYTVTLKNEAEMLWSFDRFFWLFFLGFTALILEFLAAWKLARYCERPVLALAARLGIRSDSGKSLEAIEKSWQNLYSQKEWLENAGNQYYQMAEEGFLSSLLYGTFEKENAMEYARKFSLPFNDQLFYQALLFQYLGESEKTFNDAMLHLQIACYQNEIPAIYCREEKVLLLAGKQKEGLVSQKEQLLIVMDEKFPELEAELYPGEIHGGFEGIAKSYREGRERQTMTKKQGQTNYYYPLEIELRMINSMKLRNFKETEELLKSIQQENEERHLLSGELGRVEQLIYEIFRRFALDMQMEAELNYDFLHEAEGAKEGWNQLFSMLDKIRDSYKQPEERQELGWELVSYVDAHYDSSELSQQDIAGIFQISRPMVSKIFKETARMNFIDYLQKKRVEKAKELFDNGNPDVLAVGQQVGYENEVTFKRAFVKLEGITPREYVKIRKNSGK